MIGASGFSGSALLIWVQIACGRTYPKSLHRRENRDSMLAGHIELVRYNACLCKYLSPTVLEGNFARSVGENI